MSSCEYIGLNSNPKVYIDNSHVIGGGKGLFTVSNYRKNTPMVIYYGDKITDQQVYDMYIKNPNDYYDNFAYFRGTPNGYVVNGKIVTTTNLNICGVYANDIQSITCNKEELTKEILKTYAHSITACNLKVVDTRDYPVYSTSMRVKKGDELYVHYGIGYWLAYIRCTPEEISDLNDEYDFSSLYEDKN